VLSIIEAAVGISAQVIITLLKPGMIGNYNAVAESCDSCCCTIERIACFHWQLVMRFKFSALLRNVDEYIVSSMSSA